MKHKDIASHCYGTLYLHCEKIPGKLIYFRLYGIGKIYDIRCMDHKLFNAVLFHILMTFFDAKFRNIFTFCILRCTGIHHKRIGTIGCSLFSRAKKHFLSAHTAMRSDKYPVHFIIIPRLF